jgi:hypothetical protein
MNNYSLLTQNLPYLRIIEKSKAIPTNKLSRLSGIVRGAWCVVRIPVEIVNVDWMIILLACPEQIEPNRYKGAKNSQRPQ